MSGWKLQEFQCTRCPQTTESLERSAEMPDSIPCACGGNAERCISAPKVKTVWAWCDRQVGPKDECPPWSYDTEHLANDGYSYE
jgi:hypothetical protein